MQIQFKRAALGVLGDQPGRGRHGDAAGQLLVDDGAWRSSRVPRGPGGDALRRWRRRSSRAGTGERRRRRARRAAGTGGGRWGARPSDGGRVGATIRWEGLHGRVYPAAPVATMFGPDDGGVHGTTYHSCVSWARSLPAPLRRPLSRLVHAAWEARPSSGPSGRTIPAGRRFGRDGRRGLPALPPGRHLQRAPHPHRGRDDRRARTPPSRPAWRPGRRCRPIRSSPSAAAASSGAARTSSATGRS